MADDLIPDDVKQFIVSKIDSVAELEGLLLLYRNPETGWSAETLAQRLYTSRQQTGNVLARLYAQGFWVAKEDPSPSYLYQPKSFKLAEMVERLAEIYSKYLVPVTNIIHSKSKPKIQQFADAFKLKNQEDE